MSLACICRGSWRARAARCALLRSLRESVAYGSRDTESVIRGKFKLRNHFLFKKKVFHRIESMIPWIQAVREGVILQFSHVTNGFFDATLQVAIAQQYRQNGTVHLKEKLTFKYILFKATNYF